MRDFKQGDRLPGDGSIVVSQDEKTVWVKHEHPTSSDPKDSPSIALSHFNAARLLAGLALMLGVRIHPEDAKKIRM
jgi:hypothetical protein